MNGTPDLLVPGGRVHVESSAGCALTLNGNAILEAARVTVRGTACAPGGAISGPLEEGAGPVPDPLADLLPAPSDWESLRASLPQPEGQERQDQEGGTYTPGEYPGGIDLTGNKTAVLEPGLYMVGDLRLRANAVLTGDGVMLLIDQGGRVDVAGGGASLILTAPTSGPFEDVALFHHRANDASNAVKIRGNGTLDIEGTVYVPAGPL